jgi:alpha-tubulin suppressor-like RCC1 family protein
LPERKLATNRDFSLVINDFGDLYGWGNNRDERLGINEFK